MQQLLQYVLHIDTYLLAFVAAYGVWTYVLLFAVIFCETGLIVTPFLPGDSLLFAAGSMAANPDSALKLRILFVALTIASILGNKLNYLIGKAIGPRVFAAKTRLLNQKYLAEAHAFYEKHGGKTIIFARFIPIVRTFAPFVAGVAYMSLRQFSLYNVVSAILWIGSLLAAGFYFGKLPFIKDHFSVVIYGIVALSLLPPTLAFLYRKAFATP